ncbi:MAG TPA: hypothetical protein VF407_08655, partial [Polyangiaceae bacterium]
MISSLPDVERACAFVAAHAQKKAPHRWKQGPRKPAWPCDVSAADVRLFAETRVRAVTDPAARALVEAAHGRRPLHVLGRVPTPNEVLALQAKGERCVSLLPDDAHPDPLDFALHDLCHLEKFVDAESYEGQVGFFGAVHRANLFERYAHLDEAFQKDFEHVVADMNGSPIFLFAALKMKLKMAARREVGRRRNVPAKVSGALDEDETALFVELQSDLFAALELPAEARVAADAVSTKRDAPELAVWLQNYFSVLGR